MNYSKLLKFAAISSALLMGSAHAQTASTTGLIIQSIPAAVAFRNVNPINFGDFLAGTTAGTVTLTCGSNGNAGGTTVSGGLTKVTDGSCGVVFIGNPGSDSVTFTFALTGTDLTATGGGSGTAIATTIVAYNAAGTVISGTQTVAGGGGATELFNMGGTATLAANQAVGTYSGTYTFTATVQ